MQIYRLVPIIALPAIILTIHGARVEAGEYHVGDQNICSDCHILHASKESETWTPTARLLKNSAGEVALCMSCHDGTDPQAADVVAAGTSLSPLSTVTTAYTSKYGSSAGFFQTDYLAAINPCSHDLMPNVSVTAPLSTSYTKAGGLVCSDCHDPHGTPNYRNLRSDPNSGHPGSFDILVGTQVKETTPFDPQLPNADVVCDAGNISFYAQNNVNEWCADCHDKLSSNSAGSSPAHFKGHPTGIEIGTVYLHTNLANWQSGVQGPATGFGSDVGDSAPGIPRVRYGSPTGSNTITNFGDRVFCLSCHKAHGSQYKYGLVWPYHQSSADMLSGCQQCHFK